MALPLATTMVDRHENIANNFGSNQFVNLDQQEYHDCEHQAAQPCYPISEPLSGTHLGPLGYM